MSLFADSLKFRKKKQLILDPDVDMNKTPFVNSDEGLILADTNNGGEDNGVLVKMTKNLVALTKEHIDRLRNGEDVDNILREIPQIPADPNSLFGMNPDIVSNSKQAMIADAKRKAQPNIKNREFLNRIQF